MDFISEEFFAAHTGEALEARLRDSGTFRQQMKSLHEASKAFSKDSGMLKKGWKLYDRLEDEWTKYNILYGGGSLPSGFSGWGADSLGEGNPGERLCPVFYGYDTSGLSV